MRIATLWCAAVISASALSCSPTALVPAARSVMSSEDVSVEARTLAWTGMPRDLERHYTAVLVRVTNGGRRPIAIGRDSFALLAASRSFARVSSDRIEGTTPEVAAVELKPAVLEPGQDVSGFIYFERVEGSWGVLALRTSIEEPETGALLDTIDVAFGQTRLVTCTLWKVEKTAPWERGTMFDTCLLPH